MEPDYVKIEIKNRIGYLILNRPEKKNALNATMVSEMNSALLDLQENEKVKVVVLKGSGTVFCSGVDLQTLEEMQGYGYEKNLEDSRGLKDLFYQIHTFPKVVIAQIQGHALAGGCGLVTVCDFAFSVPEAKFGYTEVKIGFVPAIVMVFLLRKIGEATARELLLGGEVIQADQALNIGMIHQVVPKNTLDKKVKEFAEKLIKSNSGQSMAIIKQMMAHVPGKSLDDGLKYAAEMNAKARNTDDCKKGIAAFLQKKSIDW